MANKNEKTTNTFTRKKQSGPWRPPKVFVPKPKVKQSGPGRPKKATNVWPASHHSRSIRWFISSNILQAPKRDNIILLLFIFSLLIFLLSLYVVILKNQKTIEQQLIRNTNPVANIASGNIPFVQDQVSTGISKTAAPLPIDTSNVIPAFYDAFNQKDVKTLYTLTDSSLNTSNVFITYFTTNRLTRFLGGLSDGVSISDLQMRVLATNTPGVQEMTYTLEYTLKDGTNFSENRSAVLIRRGDVYKIRKLMCETTGCSQMPFFNPGKYGIE